MSELIDDWKAWHRELSDVLGCFYLDRTVTLDAARRLCDRLDAIERQVIYRTEAMPPDAVLWVKISQGMCQVRDCDGNGIPWVDYRPDHEGPVCLPIIDAPDSGRED